MAAVKLHLKNNDKSYKLKKTNRKTTEGRIIYENTLTGEFHSELSMTLEMPEGSGNWINVPSLINGRVYNRQGVLDMLKAGNITPNSTGHLSETEAVEAAIYRSNNLQDDNGVSLKPNNEVELKNNDQKIVRAFQPAYTTGSAANAGILANAEAALASDQQTDRLTAIMNNQDLEKQDDYYKWFEGSNRPERILDKATQYIDKSGPTHREVMDKQVSDNQNRITRKELWNRLPGEKQDEFYDPNKPRTNVWGDNNPRYWEGLGKGVGGPKALQNAYEQPPLSVRDKRLFDFAASQNFGDEDASFDANGGYLNTPTDDGVFNYKGLKLNPANQLVAKDEQVYGGGNYNLQPDDDGSFYYGDVPGKSKMRDDGSFYYGDVAGKSRIRDDGPFDYGKDDVINPKLLRPNQKQIVREVVNVTKNVKPDYGKMPGFKFKSAGYKKPDGEEAGYWSADETSPFWQTDAGYEKSIKTWGEKPGWVKPGYRPKKKELDIEAIKKWFTSSK